MDKIDAALARAELLIASGMSVKEALKVAYMDGFSEGLDRGISMGLKDAQAAAEAEAEAANPPSNWHRPMVFSNEAAAEAEAAHSRSRKGAWGIADLKAAAKQTATYEIRPQYKD